MLAPVAAAFRRSSVFLVIPKPGLWRGICFVAGGGTADSLRDKAALGMTILYGFEKGEKYPPNTKRPMTWFSHGTYVEQPSPEVCSIARYGMGESV
jgi:hypothetical protein